MGRQKKNELDVVLEQLKKSYSVSVSDDLEDSLLETASSEDDAELTSILEKIFSKNDVEDSGTDIDSCANAVDNVEDVLENDNESYDGVIHDEEISANILDKPTETITEEVLDDAVDFDDDNVISEEEKVDDILKTMFGTSEHIDHVNDDHELTGQEDNNDDEAVPEDNDWLDKASDEENISEINVVNNIIDDIKTFEDTESVEILNCHNAEEVIEVPSVETEQIILKDEGTFEDITEEAATANVTNIIEESTKILDPDRYIYDELQKNILDISFFKPESDLDFSQQESVPVNDDKECEDSSFIQEQGDEISDKDISLLMKFGYDSEINATGENDHAYKVLFDESKKYIPGRHKIAHGFTGKEFYSPSQIPEIEKKYKSDIISILIMAIIISVIAITLTAMDIAYVFGSIDHNIVALSNIISVVTVTIILYSRVIAGISSIIKFDANEYSSASVVICEYFICSIAMYFLHFFSEKEFTHICIGGGVLLYVAFTVWAEWFDCYRESKVFSFIVNENNKYVAEKRTFNDKLHNNKRRSSDSDEEETKFYIKKADFISGYHYKTIESKKDKMKIVLVVGILPAVSVILGILTSLINNDFSSGINSVLFILFLSVPFSASVTWSAIELINHLKLKKNSSVVIGSPAFLEAIKAKTLIFDDSDAVEILSCTEINPNKNATSSKKWYNIARSVFDTLGGPISKALGRDSENDPNIEHSISINSISDNGIDIYFDSTMNILIGDRQYMLSHNIKVKTDVNLTGAVKGTQRSVIYMAFDRIPQIGFILNSKIKGAFIRSIEFLKNNGIDSEIKSYEPQTNEYFFETNNIEYPLSVVKPSGFENSAVSNIGNARLVSSSPYELCRAIISSQKTIKDYADNKKIRNIQSVLGIILSVLLTAVLCIPNSVGISEIVKNVVPFAFYGISAIMLIPNVIHIICVIKRK